MLLQKEYAFIVCLDDFFMTLYVMNTYAISVTFWKSYL